MLGGGRAHRACVAQATCEACGALQWAETCCWCDPQNALVEQTFVKGELPAELKSKVSQAADMRKAQRAKNLGSEEAEDDDDEAPPVVDDSQDGEEEDPPSGSARAPPPASVKKKAAKRSKPPSKSSAKPSARTGSRPKKKLRGAERKAALL